MSSTTQPMGLAKTAAIQITSGGAAGLVEVSIMHPLDVVKTRLQLQKTAGKLTNDPNHYKSLGDVFRKMYTHEGPFSFYKGILPPILAETPKRATKFFTFEQYKKLFSHLSTKSVTIFTLAGLCSGLTEALVINPFEVVKVKLQAERTHLNQQKSAIATAREIIHENGFGTRGINKGLTATLGRHGVWNMIYFSFYHNMKTVVPKQTDKSMDFVCRFGLGLAAGTLASIINIPFDVAKSRIQGPQPVPGHIKYKTCFATILTVYREEGYFALYKGLLPKILRLGPGGAIMLIVYETVYELLQNKLHLNRDF